MDLLMHLAFPHYDKHICELFQVTKDVIAVASNVMDVDPEIVKTAEKRENAATKILEQLDNLAETLRKKVISGVQNTFFFIIIIFTIETNK